MTNGHFSTLRWTRLSRVRRHIPAFLLSLLPLPAVAQEYFLGPGAAQGETLFIEPNSPRANEDILIYYPRRGCNDDRVDARMKGNEIEIVVNHYGQCLYTFQPEESTLPGSGLYRTYRIGRLPVGNYRIRLYYQDLSESSRSRSFSISESFSVMPAR